MSNYELLSVVVESLIRKTAELEQKNADLERQVKKSNEEKQGLQFALDLQEDINNSLQDDLKKKDTKIAVVCILQRFILNSLWAVSKWQDSE